MRVGRVGGRVMVVTVEVVDEVAMLITTTTIAFDARFTLNQRR